MISLTKLRHLIAVDRAGSFTAGAKALHITQSSLTKSVAEIERQIGYPVFERNARGVLATRVKDMVITGGENVFSAEVENAVSTFAGVLQVAVIGIPDERCGEAVHAIIVTKGGAALDSEAITQHCRNQLANYKLPRSFEFRAEPLPLSGAGKVLKRELRKPHWDGTEKGVS